MELLKKIWNSLNIEELNNGGEKDSIDVDKFDGEKWREIQIRDNGKTKRLIVPVKDRRFVEGR